MDYKQKYQQYKQLYMDLSSQNGGASRRGGSNGENSNIENILEKFFEHQMHIKMLHFQTKNYGRHKSLDSYLSKFNGNFDRFMEVSQGNLDRRVTNKNIKVDVKMMFDDDVFKYLDIFIKEVLNGVIESSFGKEKGLAAIRDEMVADAEQLKYLLTFK